MSLNISSDIIEIDHPGMFASADRKAICWDGEIYYKSCGSFVANLADGGQSSCIKPLDHINTFHEDSDGRLAVRRAGDEATIIGEDSSNG